MTLWAPCSVPCTNVCAYIRSPLPLAPSEGFKISTWIWPWLLSITVSVLQDVDYVILHACFKRWVFVLCSPPAVLYRSFAVIKPVILGAHFPSAAPGWGTQCGAWASSLQESLWRLWLSSGFVGCPPRGVGVDCTVFLLSYSSSVVPSLYLWLWEIFYARLQVILVDSCSVNTCNFAVILGEGEFRVSPSPILTTPS